jgi:hypothetical protein
MLKYACIIFFLSFSFNSLNQVKDAKNSKRIIKDIDLLSEQLTKSCVSDSEKVAVIYHWITNNIAYDYKKIKSKKPIDYQSPENVLKTQKAICGGYVELMKLMLEKVSIKSEYIEGYTRMYDLDSTKILIEADHAWIAFNIDDKWYLADPTWDAGYVGKIPKKLKTEPKRWSKTKSFKILSKFRSKKREARISKKRKRFEQKQETRNPYKDKVGFVPLPGLKWFMIETDSFLVSHLPAIPQWQLKSKTITCQQFCNTIEAFKKELKNPKGEELDFEVMNEEYSQMNILDKWVYVGDKGNQFNPYNAGIKAIHYHNFVGVLTDKTIKNAFSRLQIKRSTPLFESLISMTDTVLIYGKTALDINKIWFKETKKQFATFAKEDQLNDKDQKKILTQIEKSSEKVKSSINKSFERIDKEEDFIKQKLKYLEGKYPTIKQDKTIPDYAIKNLDSILKIKDSLFKVFDDYTNETNLAPNLSTFNRLYEELSNTDYFIRQNTVYLAANTQELNPEINELDSLSRLSMLKLHTMILDSISKEIPNDTGFKALKEYEQFIKKNRMYFIEMEKKKKIQNASLTEEYLFHLLHKKLIECYKFNLKSTQFNDYLESAILNFILEDKQLIQLVGTKSQVREERKQYISHEFEVSYQRDQNIYTTILKNAKSWKKIFKKNLK